LDSLFLIPQESIATTERYLGSKLNYQDAAGDRLRLNVQV
jgi:hypothetical protein